MSTGNLSIEAQTRYRYIEQLVRGEQPASAKVIELGAAPGDQIARFARLGFDATAIDIDIDSDNWGGADQGRMRSLFEKSGVTYIPWNLEEHPYPVPDEHFDAVVMTEVFEHLRDYPLKSLMEVRRMLRIGGRLYFTTPNQAYLMNRLRLLSGQNVATPLGDWMHGQVFARHAREYTFKEIAELMKASGLSVVRQESRHFHQDSGRQSMSAVAAKRALDQIARCRPTLGPQIIIVAERR